MKNIKFSIKDLRHIKPDNRYLFLLVLLLILLLDGFVAKDAVFMVIQLEKQTAPASPVSGGVRLNFNDYNYVVQRMENGTKFQPTGGLVSDPFNPRPAPAAAQGTTTPAYKHSGGWVLLP